MLLGMLVHSRLFYWSMDVVSYFEKAYFTLKATFVIHEIIMAYASSYRVLGLCDNGHEVTDILTCLYFSLVTWTTLGYGDVQPSVQARLLAASEALVGYVVMAVFVGLLAGVFLRFFVDKHPAGEGTHQPPNL